MANPEPEERSLIERVARGDKAAFEVLVKAYEPRLLAFMARVTGQRDVAQEIAQDAFVKAYFKIGTFGFRCSFYTWLCEIAINKFLDWRKQRRRWFRKHALTDFTEPHAPPDGSQSPSERAASRETGRIVRDAIARLSPDHQRVLLLREFQGASYEEIAAAMRCSVGTVESRLFRARQRLKEILKPWMEKNEL